MARKSQCLSVSTFLGFVLFTCALMHPASSQSQSSSESSQPVSLAHLYWHFLTYQNHLDTVAAAQAAQGNNGSVLSGLMQARLGFPDADFAFVRTSSVRLAAEVQSLNAQATAIQAGGTTATSQTQLSALTAQREADISAEISYLQQNLSPAEVTTLQNFLYQLFSLPNPAGQSSSTTVQQ